MSGRSRTGGLTVGLVLIGALVSAGCRATAEASESDLTRLAGWMTGSFSSAQQASQRPDDYFDIRLEMVPIWTDRDDGPWLYVEQAAATALERPYRQRVYHLVETSGSLVSDVYELPGDPQGMAGAWRTPERFDAIAPEDLALREGCSIRLAPEGGAFVGSTLGTGCSSSLGGASYATSEVRIEPHVLISWDRGFDAAGEQVWGAVPGGYVFERMP